ncbi:MAG: flagellar assembly protein FliW [Candidatus Sumerlaeota bacterium]|nr:flagellar assembly protein FliW [Candidatus Sumerlaeota bacterium]
MRFHTTRFGELEVPDETIIVIREGILGFPEESRYVLLDHDAEGTPFKWLQSIENPSLAFVVMDPSEIVPEYSERIGAEAAEQLDAAGTEDLIPMVICTIPHENPARMTANLRAPIVVNALDRAGRQIILNDDVYQFDHCIFSESASPADSAGEKNS